MFLSQSNIFNPLTVDQRQEGITSLQCITTLQWKKKIKFSERDLILVPYNPIYDTRDYEIYIQHGNNYIFAGKVHTNTFIIPPHKRSEKIREAFKEKLFELTDFIENEIFTNNFFHSVIKSSQGDLFSIEISRKHHYTIQINQLDKNTRKPYQYFNIKFDPQNGSFSDDPVENEEVATFNSLESALESFFATFYDTNKPPLKVIPADDAEKQLEFPRVKR